MIVPFITVTRSFIKNKCRPSNIPKKFQLINQSLADKFPNYSLRNFFFGVHEDFGNSFPICRRNSGIFLIFWTKHLPLISRILKDNSISITRNCLEQVEFVIAHRIRRGQQMITLYSRLWDERALRLLLQQMKSMFQRKAKHFIIGSSFVAFNWDSERITVDEMKSHLDELNVCKILRSKACNGHNGKPEIDSVLPDCSCDDYPDTIHEWEPFIIEDDMTVWKKPHTNFKSTGLYCYKLYGRYEDVTADDFLQVFLDTDNRTKWDTHAADLKIIDTEPVSQSEVIYWETRWPTLFSNRDYVFKRRYYKDEVNKVIIVLNKSTEHPLCPPNTSKARVTEYWSYMVIKAQTDLNEPGMEFSLTYFDNPGIALPTTVSLWVTVQGMPEYLKRLKIEALAVSERRKLQGLVEKTEEKNKEDTAEKKCSQTPPSPPGPPTPSTVERDSQLNSYDYLFIFSSYFQKLRSSLWM